MSSPTICEALLLDYYAASAMQGRLAAHAGPLQGGDIAQLARDSFEAAEAMLVERKRRAGEDGE